MKKLFSMTMLLLVSLIISADENEQGSQNGQGTNTAQEVVVITNDKYENGTVEVLKKDGRVVTITVTPADGYYIEKSDVEVIPVKDPSTTRTEESESTVPTGSDLVLTLVDKDGKPVVDEKSEPVADAADLTQARYYQFTVPEGLGAWISKADFHKIGTEGTLNKTVTWSITTSEAKQGETAIVTLTIDGEGAATIKEDAAAPWDIQKTKITNVVIGAEITELGKGLLSGCTALVSVEIQNDAAIVTLGEGAIPANKGLEVDVPGNLFNEYETTDGWKDFTIKSTTGVEMKDVAFEANNNYDTFCSDKAVKIPSVLNAFVITAIKGNAVVIEEIKDGIIPAGVPVLLLSKQLKSKKLMTAVAASETKGGTYTSILKVADKDVEVELGSVYLLYNDVFYLSMKGTIKKGGIYLPKPKEESKTRSALTIGDNGTTAIDAERLIDNEELIMDNSCWYDLSGRRLSSKPTTKGIYIMNGRKVVIK